MKTKASLVRSDRGVELDAETAVDLDVALVIDPRDAEDDLSLRLDNAVEDTGFDEVRAGVGNRIEGREDLGDCLDELRLGAVSLFNRFKDVV